MGKFLIILTRKYPYSYGETSLQDELAYHVTFYDKVLVLAQDVNVDDPETRQPPKGVEYYNTATRSRNISRLMDKIKCPLRVFDYSDAMRCDSDRIKKHIVRRVFLYAFEERCQRLIREAENILDHVDFSSCDEVVLYSYWFFANARAAVGISDYLKRRGCSCVRVVSRAHRYDLYENRNRIKYLPMREFLLDNMEKVYACSLDGAKYLRAMYPQYKDKIEVGLLGTVDCGECEIKRSKVFHIVSCCRIVPVKRMERIADALALLDVPCRWTMIGGGINGDAYYNKVKNHVLTALKSTPYIQVEFTGALPHDQIFEYYKNNSVDVFINVSSSEGIPQVIMEASSFGIPIIATDVGGTTEIVLDGQNGYILPEFFSDQLLSEKIKKMMSLSDDDYYQMRRSSRQIWEERFNAVKNNTRFARQVYFGNDNSMSPEESADCRF